MSSILWRSKHFYKIKTKSHVHLDGQFLFHFFRQKIMTADCGSADHVLLLCLHIPMWLAVLFHCFEIFFLTWLVCAVVGVFDSLRKCDGIPFRMLNMQYRMHPAISEFPSQKFYNNLLKDGISSRDRPRPKGIFWPNEQKPIVFYNLVVIVLFTSVLHCCMCMLLH